MDQETPRVFQNSCKKNGNRTIINDEWIHNRDEDDPNFNDFEWWDPVDGLIEKEFPNGVFTPKSLEALREYSDKKESEAILKYWKEHPDEHKRLMDELDKKTKELQKKATV